VAATTPPLDTSEASRSSGRRRGAVIAGVLLLVLAALGAVLIMQKGDDSSDVATNGGVSGGSVTTAASNTTAAPADGGSNGETVTVNTDVLFDVGSSQLTAAASSRLGNVLSLAQTDASRHVLVEGFTDSDGDASLNQQLSEARAQAVAQWLIEQGIDSARISAVGHGADNPVAPNDTPENKALNRRVVVALQT
jgi:outer membrane protein OmpA-like peptidoglycan-associated protein